MYAGRRSLFGRPSSVNGTLKCIVSPSPATTPSLPGFSGHSVILSERPSIITAFSIRWGYSSAAIPCRKGGKKNHKWTLWQKRGGYDWPRKIIINNVEYNKTERGVATQHSKTQFLPEAGGPVSSPYYNLLSSSCSCLFIVEAIVVGKGRVYIYIVRVEVCICFQSIEKSACEDGLIGFSPRFCSVEA